MLGLAWMSAGCRTEQLPGSRAWPVVAQCLPPHDAIHPPSPPHAVTLDLPFGRPLNKLVTLASRAADAVGFDSAPWLDSWRRAKLVLLDAGMAMRLSKDDQRNM